jgi:hypothetical protein
MNGTNPLSAPIFRTVRIICPIKIKAGCSVEQGVAAGQYDWSSREITSEHFPVNETADSEFAVELIAFEQDVKTGAVLDAMDKAGLRPIRFSEELAIGEQHPDLQKEFQIVCLGSSWQRSDGRMYCTCLTWDGARRGLGIFQTRKTWLVKDNFVFAAVRT